MEEEFEKKPSKKYLKILIPIIILILVIGAGIAYYFITNMPKNIFSKAVDNIFEKSAEEKYSSLKTNIELSMNIESDNSEVQSANLIFSNAKVTTNQEIDLANKIANQAFSISFLGQDLINLEYIIQNDTSYMFVKDVFTKYVEVPLEDIELNDIFETSEQLENIANEQTLREVKNIIKSKLKDKNFEQTKEEIQIDNENVKTTKSTLVLTADEFINTNSSILKDIKDNEKIMSNFNNTQEIKKEIQNIINSMQDLSEKLQSNGQEKVKLSIYTKGIKNEFVRFDIELQDTESTAKISITEVSENDYLISISENSKSLIKMEVKNDKKDKKSGILTIRIELQDIMNTMMNSDNMELNQDKITAVLKAKYNVEYNAKIQSADTSDSVKLEEMTEEEMNEIYENFQKTELYTLLEQSGLFGNNSNDIFDETSQDTTPMVTIDGYTVLYTVPDTFKSETYNTSDYKYYFDENLNSVIVRIEKETKENYFDLLKEADALTVDLYDNQEISGIKTIDIGDKQFSYRTITYTYNGTNYIDTYYCYEIAKGYLYIVETNMEEKAATEQINEFLKINV